MNLCPSTFQRSIDERDSKGIFILRINTVLDRLREYVEKEDYSGYDPYDALNSPFIRALTFEKKWGRVAWIQFLRRFPYNLRPVFFVPKGQNPKGLGLFLWGYAKLYRTDPCPEYLEKIHYLLQRLSETRSQGFSGNGWGYNFDWQSRAFFVPKHTPTIVNSSFIGHALLDTWEITGEENALNLVVPIQDFLLKDLQRTVAGNTFCFSYTPADNSKIHNANLLGASLLIRLHKIMGNQELREVGLASLAYSMKHQREDGSWYYGESAQHHWIDSFHTGFNLQAIRYFLSNGEGLEYFPDYEKGVAYYAENFFQPDGMPKYYHNKVYPVDIHVPAQAIAFFSTEGLKYRDVTDRVIAWSLNHLWDPRGFFYFRKGPWVCTKIPYMRWSQAWMFHALTEYVFSTTSREADSE